MLTTRSRLRELTTTIYYLPVFIYDTGHNGGKRGALGTEGSYSDYHVGLHRRVQETTDSYSACNTHYIHLLSINTLMASQYSIDRYPKNTSAI